MYIMIAGLSHNFSFASMSRLPIFLHQNRSASKEAECKVNQAKYISAGFLVNVIDFALTSFTFEVFNKNCRFYTCHLIERTTD